MTHVRTPPPPPPHTHTINKQPSPKEKKEQQKQNKKQQAHTPKKTAIGNGLVQMISNLTKIWLCYTVKPVLSGHSKRTPKNGFQYQLSLILMKVKSIAECSNRSILQYFRPALSYHLSLRPLFCLFLSGRLRQVLLYNYCRGSVSGRLKKQSIFPPSLGNIFIL